MRLGVAALLVCLGAGACVSPTSVFTCEQSTQCTVGGMCQPTGYCSFPDLGCPSGQRYGDAAGDGLAGTCVGGGGTIDADPNDPDADTPPPDANPNCLAPFVTSQYGCHAFLQPMATSFDDGRQKCLNRGADLAVVQSEGESSYIAKGAQLVEPQRALMGLERRDTPTWTWVDGSTLTFTYWNPGEPGPSEPCGVIRPDGLWAGRSCTENFVLVCEK